MKLSEKLKAFNTSEKKEENSFTLDKKFHHNIYSLFSAEKDNGLTRTAFQKPCINSPISKKIFLC